MATILDKELQTITYLMIAVSLGMVRKRCYPTQASFLSKVPFTNHPTIRCVPHVLSSSRASLNRASCGDLKKWKTEHRDDEKNKIRCAKFASVNLVKGSEPCWNVYKHCLYQIIILCHPQSLQFVDEQIHNFTVIERKVRLL